MMNADTITTTTTIKSYPLDEVDYIDYMTLLGLVKKQIMRNIIHYDIPFNNHHENC